MASTETCTTRYRLLSLSLSLCVRVFPPPIKLHYMLVGMMRVENRRPEDIKVAGRKSWTNCECRMLEIRFFKVALMLLACIVIKHMRIVMQNGCFIFKLFCSWLINLLPTWILWNLVTYQLRYRSLWH